MRSEAQVVANATVVMFSMLVHALDEKGALDRKVVADSLEDAWSSAQMGAPEHGSERLDLKMFREAVNLIRFGPEAPRKA